MKSNLRRIVISLLVLLVAYIFTRTAERTISKEEFTKIELLCESSVKTVGIIDESVKETTFKIKSVEGKMYELAYNYEVDAKNYKATKTVTKLDEDISPIIEVWYAPASPSRNSIVDPCTTFDDYKNNKRTGSTAFFNIGSLILGFSGIINLLAAIVDIFTDLFRKKRSL